MKIFSKNRNLSVQEGKTLKVDQVDMLLEQLRLPLSFIFTPTNLVEEKEKFLDSDNYNPQFTYEIVKNRNEEIFKELSDVKEISDVDPVISDFYLQLIQEKELTWHMIQAVGQNAKFTKLAIEKFGLPSYKLFRNACIAIRTNGQGYNLVNEAKLKEENYLTYPEIKVAIEEVFKGLGIEGWGVDKSKKILKNGVKVGLKKKMVYMDPDIKKKPTELKGTIVHEIGTHVIRHLNGLECGVKAFSRPNISSYLETEEGLAAYNEELMHFTSLKDLKKRALYVYAVQVGREMSFRGLYNAVSPFMLPKRAFNFVMRVKRGLGDTSLPGIYPKDIVYFRGLRRVKRKLEKDPYLYDLLYAGKISFKQTKWVEEGILRKPKFVPCERLFANVFKESGL